MRNVRGAFAPAMGVSVWRVTTNRPTMVSRQRRGADSRLQVLGRLDDLGDEVLADGDQRRVLGEVAGVDGRALRLDQVTLDRVAGEVVDLRLGRRARLVAALGLRDGGAADEDDQSYCTDQIPHGRPSQLGPVAEIRAHGDSDNGFGFSFPDSFQKVPRSQDTPARPRLRTSGRVISKRYFFSGVPLVGAAGAAGWFCMLWMNFWVEAMV